MEVKLMLLAKSSFSIMINSIMPVSFCKVFVYF